MTVSNYPKMIQSESNTQKSLVKPAVTSQKLVGDVLGPLSDQQKIVPKQPKKRAACVLVPALPLQLLFRERPDWKRKPAVVIDDSSRVSHLNYRAYKEEVRLGMRLIEARNLVPDLRAETVSAETVRAAREEILRGLQNFSPRVEIVDNDERAFYLDPNGLSRLYGGLGTWSDSLIEYLRARQFEARLVVGFSQALTYASACLLGANLEPESPAHGIVKSKTRAWVHADAKREWKFASHTPLRALNIEAKVCEHLRALDIHTLEQFLMIPEPELHARFGKAVAHAHAKYAGHTQLPLQPEKHHEKHQVELEVNPPDDHMERLLFGTKRCLDPLIKKLKRNALSIRTLILDFEFEREKVPLKLTLSPAQSTLDAGVLLELVRLRLTQTAFPDKVEKLRLQVLVENTESVQTEANLTQSTRKRREPAAAQKALARVKALLGDESVTTAVLKEAHLPEAQFAWSQDISNATRALQPKSSNTNVATTAITTSQKTCLSNTLLSDQNHSFSEPLHSESLFAEDSNDNIGLNPCKPSNDTAHAIPLVQRVFDKPVWVPALDQNDPEKGPALFSAAGQLPTLYGPFRISGGWWSGKSTSRDYYQVEALWDKREQLLSVFYDRIREKWFVHGSFS